MKAFYSAQSGLLRLLSASASVCLTFEFIGLRGFSRMSGGMMRLIACYARPSLRPRPCAMNVKTSVFKETPSAFARVVTVDDLPLRPRPVRLFWKEQGGSW